MSASRGEAHKPITSPFTFSDDVRPILQAQCGSCHVQGGVAPMPLLTHDETVPWGASIRAELLAGHMPPWTVDGPLGRFQNAQALTARELNVLLTWVSGGTPPGDLSKPPAASPADAEWRLGPPDLVLPLPSEHTLDAGEQDATVEFRIAAGNPEPLWVRAVDVRPGTPAIVRGATVRAERTGAPAGDGTAPQPVLAVWVPGDHPVALSGDAAFVLPPNAELVVSMHYRKTWEYERQVMTDRSAIGLYVAAARAPALHALVLAPESAGTAAPGAGGAARSGTSPAPISVSSADGQGAVFTPAIGSQTGTFSYTRTIRQDLRALAIYPDAALTGAHVAVTAMRPDGSREELIAFRPKAGWARRYWFAEPIPLPRGTVITVTAHPDAALLPPGALPDAEPVAPSDVRLTLDVVPAS